MILASIIAAGLAGGVLSVLVAGLIVMGFPQRWLSRLVGFAAGTMLAAALLDILPEAFEASGDPHELFAVLLFGLIGFYALQRAALWRHSHPEDEPAEGHAAHSHGHGHHHHGHSHALGREVIPSILLGDGFHNFVDGVLIAAAFLADPALGWTTALAVIAHEIPQEAGDFVLLRAAGLSTTKAMLANIGSSLASVLGGITGYFALNSAQEWVPTILTLAGASFLYIAVADLIPLLRRELSRRAIFWQSSALLAGIAMVALLTQGHAH